MTEKKTNAGIIIISSAISALIVSLVMFSFTSFQSSDKDISKKLELKLDKPVFYEYQKNQCLELKSLEREIDLKVDEDQFNKLYNVTIENQKDIKTILLLLPKN